MEENKKMVVMSNQLARKGTRWNLKEHKLFLMTIVNIKNRNELNEVELNKSEVKKYLGLENSDNKRLRMCLEKFMINSFIKFGDDECFDDGLLIKNARIDEVDKNKLYVEVSNKYLPLMEEMKEMFTTFYLEDVAPFKHKTSIMLFQDLISWQNKNKFHYTQTYSVMNLMELFDLDYEKTYRRKDNNKFQINVFEKYCIIPAINEIREKNVLKNIEWKRIKKDAGVNIYQFDYELNPNRMKEDKTKRTLRWDKPVELNGEILSVEEIEKLLEELKQEDNKKRKERDKDEEENNYNNTLDINKDDLPF